MSGHQWIKRYMNGYKIWVLMDKKGYMPGYEGVIVALDING
jgi:hypothetical protein